MIKSVIFDCFGVLVQDSWLPFKQQYFSDDEELMKAATAVNIDLDSGNISFDEFVDTVAKLAGVDSVFARRQLETNPRNEQLFDYIADNLAGSFAIGLLSNAGENWLDSLFTPKQNQLFNEVVLSCDIGHVKPSRQAYAAITKKLGVEPHEAVFIDDQPKYIIGASEFGLHTVQYKSNTQAIAELEHLLNSHN